MKTPSANDELVDDPLVDLDVPIQKDLDGLPPPDCCERWLSIWHPATTQRTTPIALGLELVVGASLVCICVEPQMAFDVSSACLLVLLSLPPFTL